MVYLPVILENEPFIRNLFYVDVDSSCNSRIYSSDLNLLSAVNDQV